MTCCFTGHRIIRAEHLDIIHKNLPILIRKLSMSGITNFIAGGAMGFDTHAALAVLRERRQNPDISLTLALPCKNQTRNWNRQDIISYEEIRARADEVIYISDEYFNGCMQKRNRFMVDNSSHCIFYLASTRGGTAYTVKYALENGLELHNIITN